MKILAFGPVSFADSTFASTGRGPSSEGEHYQVKEKEDTPPAFVVAH